MCNMARPFLKWAGGKRQLISEIENRLPADIDECTSYVEPFIGGGAVLFHLLQNRSFEEVHISDLNPELILCYRTLQEDAKGVIKHLSKMIESYPSDQEDRKQSYYAIREDWNSNVGKFSSLSKAKKAKRVAQTLFLNKTCFNGLFRVNRKGEFNVPIGSYVNPSFPNSEDLLEVQKALQGVTIHLAPFEECESWVSKDSFVYFDPPYRPLSDTAHFVSYSKDDFNDRDQERLAILFRDLDQKGAKLLLSNSDPTNTVPEDDFFDALYAGFQIDRVYANRAINSVAKGRGAIRELLISNY